MALYTDRRHASWKSPLYTKAVGEEERIARQKALEILNFTGLTSQRNKFAADLSSGYQKLLAISMAFATNPKLLLLDEPITTLSQQMVERVMDLIVELRKAGTTVMIIEHNMRAIMNYCDKITVLAYGVKIAEGFPQEIKENEDVIEAYLGEME